MLHDPRNRVARLLDLVEHMAFGRPEVFLVEHIGVMIQRLGRALLFLQYHRQAHLRFGPRERIRVRIGHAQPKRLGRPIQTRRVLPGKLQMAVPDFSQCIGRQAMIGIGIGDAGVGIDRTPIRITLKAATVGGVSQGHQNRRLQFVGTAGIVEQGDKGVGRISIQASG